MTKLSPNTRHIWEIEKNQLEEMISNLSEEEKALVLNFTKHPNKEFIDAERVTLIDNQDGVTERWKYYLNESLFVIIEGYVPGPWSTVTSNSFHICILQEVHKD